MPWVVVSDRLRPGVKPLWRPVRGVVPYGAAIRRFFHLESGLRVHQAERVKEVIPAVAGRRAIQFRCGSCGMTLAVDEDRAGVSGPCPGCGAWLQSPPAANDAIPGGTGIPPKSSSRPTRQHGRPRGRIAGDAVLDHAHLSRRESAKSLRVLAMFVVAICICIAVAWILGDLMAE